MIARACGTMAGLTVQKVRLQFAGGAFGTSLPEQPLQPSIVPVEIENSEWDTDCAIGIANAVTVCPASAIPQATRSTIRRRLRTPRLMPNN